MNYRLYGNFKLRDSNFTVLKMKHFAEPYNGLAVITDYEKENRAYHMIYDGNLYIVDEKKNKVFVVEY